VSGKVPPDFWLEPQNRLNYVNWLVQHVGVRSPLDLKYKHFRNNGGNGLVTKFGHSPQAVIASVNPGAKETAVLQDGKTLAGLKRKRTNKFWSSIENQRAALDAIGINIGVKNGDMTPWYKMETTAFDKIGGVSIRKYYTSFYEMLKTVYSEHLWDPWRFPKAQLGLTKNSSISLKETVDHLAKELKLTDPQKWYRLTKSQIKESGVDYIIQSHGGLYQVLKKVKPEIPWDESKFVGTALSGLLVLGSLLRQIWPDLEILKDFALPQSQGVLSYYIPKLNLGFKYQNIGDYGLSGSTGQVTVSLLIDEDLALSSKSNNISLIFIPFWWDRTKVSLTATIAKKRTDLKEVLKLLQGDAQPIAQETALSLSTWRRLL
jgi:hypothetical protein